MSTLISSSAGKPPVLPDFLPGRFTLRRGRAREYAALARFHYRRSRPATWAGVWVVEYSDFRFSIDDFRLEAEAATCSIQIPQSNLQNGIVAVGVLSYPAPTVAARDRLFGMQDVPAGERLRFANRHVRTISRVIVHPRFRSLGLAAALVHRMCDECTTRYVEALAVMGRAHPLFEKAGMLRIDPDQRDPRRPVYYILDRLSPRPLQSR